MGGLSWVPRPVRSLLNRATAGRFSAQHRALRALARAHPKRLVVGSAGIPIPGWVGSDRDSIDLLREDTWARFFAPGTLDAILAEHVWEHLLPSEAAVAARTCFRFLKPVGYLRVAVPDGLHPDPSYIEGVKPGGTGLGAEDHKVLYDYGSLREVFATAGFEVRLYEYFDERGEFHYEDWDPSQGMIQRSKRFDMRNATGRLAYTSIVLDAVKPRRQPAFPSAAA